MGTIYASTGRGDIQHWKKKESSIAVESNDVRGRRLTQSTLGKVNCGINNYELILLRNDTGANWGRNIIYE